MDNIHTQMSSGSDSSDNEELNLAQISYNKLMYDSLEAYQHGDLAETIRLYNLALGTLTTAKKDARKMCLLKTNLGIVLYQNNEYKKGVETLEEALILIKSQNPKAQYYMPLLVKNLANLCIIYVVMNQYEKCEQYINEAINLILQSKESQKKDLLQEIIYIFYRFPNFESMDQKTLINLETKYKGPALACFYSSMGLNRELNNDLNTAYEFHRKALEQWKSCNELSFVLISLHHLLYLGEQLNVEEEEYRNFQIFYEKILQNEQFKNINPENLFKDFEVKLSVAKNITTSLRKFEQHYFTSSKESAIKSDLSISARAEPPELEGLEPFWKQALRLRILKSIKMSKLLMNEKKENKELIEQGINQMVKTIAQLSYGNNPLIEERLRNMSYAKESVNMIRAALNKLRKFTLQQIYGEPWKMLVDNKLVKSKMVLYHKRLNIPSPLIPKATRVAMTGDYILKCNKNTNGRIKKFFKLMSDSNLRWASKEKNISNASKYQAYHLSEARALLYGKTTDTLLKSYNKNLELHLCFSLVLKTRSLDFYCKPEQIDAWFIALSSELKKRNTTAYTISPGKYYWRKLKYILINSLEKDPNYKNTKYLTFAKGILAYRSILLQEKKK